MLQNFEWKAINRVLATLLIVCRSVSSLET